MSNEVAPLTITDQPVQSRAVASLPSSYLSLQTVENNKKAILLPVLSLHHADSAQCKEDL